MGNDQEVAGLKQKITNLQKENDSLAKAQQGLKVEIKKLTESPPKITSGHKAESIKYKRQERIKV